MDAKFIIKRGDLLRPLFLIAEDEIGPVDLDGVTVVFRMVNVVNGVVKINNAAATAAASIPFTAAGAVLTANGHPFNNGDAATLKTTGALPGNLSTSQKVYVVNATVNTLGLALAPGGPAIVTNSAGSGTNSLLSGRLSYAWQGTDTDTQGTYNGEFVTTQAGGPFTFPNVAPFLIQVISESEATDRAIAIKLVRDRVQPDTEPELTAGEIALEVDRAQLASVRQENTPYKIGDVVVPEIRNGHAYQCVQPGTSGGALAYRDWPTITGVHKVDGNSDPQLVWLECGHDRFNGSIFGAENNVYDIDGAARECWKLKMRRASEMVNVGSTAYKQLYDHCKEQADTFTPFYRQSRIGVRF